MASTLTTVSTSDIENELMSIWQDLFKRGSFSAQDDFFALGGNSLTAVKLLAQIESRFGIDALTPDELYERPSFSEIVASIHSNVGA